MDAFASMSREQLLAVVSTLVKQQGHELVSDFWTLIGAVVFDWLVGDGEDE